jgi:hypothetical protein
MNEPEYKLLTTAPPLQGERTDTTSSTGRSKLPRRRKDIQVRAIQRAPALVQKLYTAKLIDLRLTEAEAFLEAGNAGIAAAVSCSDWVGDVSGQG